MHRVVHCMQSYISRRTSNRAFIVPIFKVHELRSGCMSTSQVSLYTNCVGKFEKMRCNKQTDGQTKPGRDKTNALTYCTSTPAHRATKDCSDHHHVLHPEGLQRCTSRPPSAGVAGRRSIESRRPCGRAVISQFKVSGTGIPR